MNFDSIRPGALALSAVAALGLGMTNVAGAAGPVSGAQATTKTLAVPGAPTRSNLTSMESARLASPLPLPRPRPRPPICPKDAPCIPPLL